MKTSYQKGQKVKITIVDGTTYTGTVLRVADRYMKVDVGHRVFTFNFYSTPGTAKRI